MTGIVFFISTNQISPTCFFDIKFTNGLKWSCTFVGVGLVRKSSFSRQKLVSVWLYHKLLHHAKNAFCNLLDTSLRKNATKTWRLYEFLPKFHSSFRNRCYFEVHTKSCFLYRLKSSWEIFITHENWTSNDACRPLNWASLQKWKHLLEFGR